MSSSISSQQLIFRYSFEKKQMHFIEEKAQVFARDFFKQNITDYPLHPSYMSLMPAPASRLLTPQEVIPWLFENEYIPLIKDGEVHFQKRRKEEFEKKEEIETGKAPSELEDEPWEFSSELGDEPWEFFDDRETRSNRLFSGAMIVKDLNHETGVLTAVPKSMEEHRKKTQTMADRLAALGNYAAAKHLTEQAGTQQTIPAMKWIEKALERTADQVKGEKYGETAAHYSSHAAQIAVSIQQKEEEYEQQIRALKGLQTAEKKDPDSFLKAFKKARSLKPNAFEPFYFILLPLSFLATSSPEFYKKMVQKAYEVSPIQTFNCLMSWGVFRLLSDSPSSIENTEAFLKTFQESFPLDVVTSMVIHEFLTKNHRKGWSKCKQGEETLRIGFTSSLTKALQAIRSGELETARREFSRASQHHISDKRPYLYRSLIDLKNGDLLSALKQVTDLGRTIQWNRDLERTHAIGEMQKYMKDEGKTSIKLKAPFEMAVLKYLLKVFSRRELDLEAIKGFYNSMKDYLSRGDNDPLWALFAIDFAFERIGGIEKCLQNKELWNSFLELYELLPVSIYSTLKSEKEDLSEFSQFFQTDEEGKLHLLVTIRLTGSMAPSGKIAVCPRRFQLDQSSRVDYLKGLLDKTYIKFCLLFLKAGGTIEMMSEILLKDLNEDKIPIDPLFISALIERHNREGTPEQKAKLIDWAAKHFALFPQSMHDEFTRFVLRSFLKAAIPTPPAGPLLQATSNWLRLIGGNALQGSTDGSASSTPLASRSLTSDEPLNIASSTWKEIHEGQFEKASQVLDRFFRAWNHHLSKGVDPFVLRALCIAKSFTHEPNLSSLPSRITTRGYKLANHGLSILAREEVLMPYVIADKPLSQETIQKLCAIFIGQKKGEPDDAYEKRLKELEILDFSSLRQAKRFSAVIDPEPPDTPWLIPFMNVHTTELLKATFKETQRRHRLKMEKNQQIAAENPEYTQDPQFIQWVTSQNQLIANYISNPQGVENELNAQFPKFPGKETFLEELKEKAKHETAFQKLKSETPHPEKNRGKRFWQLVQQTTDLIERVTSSKRSDESFDLYCQNQEEARFVMQMIFEWGLEAWGDQEVDTYVQTFHGPEVHVWGKGPRIPHFNAGIYVTGKEKPINTHIFFP
jgi:hypothetical protein